MKRGKEWFIKELIGNEFGDYENCYNGGYEDGLAYALELAHQLDEPEKVVAPKFVADWIEEREDDLEFDMFNLVATLGEKDYDELTELEAWFNNFGNEPIETIMRMKLFGYEVEKEKLYKVSSNNQSAGFWFLSTTFDGKVNIGTNREFFEHDSKCLHITEKQIKDYDERYWQFAVEVAE